MFCPLCNIELIQNIGIFNNNMCCETEECYLLYYDVNALKYILHTQIDGVYTFENVEYSKEEFEKLLKLKAFW